MFGHQPDPVQPSDTTNNQPAFADNNSSAADSFNPALPPDPISFGAQPTPTPPVTPVTDPNNLLEPQATDGFTGAPSLDAPQTSPQTDDSNQPTVGASTPLNDLKQQALQQLSPLVGHLEQTPEEKFRTTMMMIQASDNKDLLQTAYDAANQITDEKARAQALLDVINEINYFSQQG
ncbi:MAG TPA: hypothetical protein VN031_01555 [Candidatus Microsaccharimonas sp.]|nr:hypothetical protein [Candidatus Microsaccharimonas sp.]